MRIISGYGKGRKLHTPTGNSLIRPTSDRARESLFNILSEHISQSCVIDLFCGTGAFGVEAISRGASTVTFVDNNKKSLELTKKNIAIVIETLQHYGKTAEEIQIKKQDITKIDFNTFLFSKLSFEKIIIFLDPPYSQGLSQKVIMLIDQVEELPDNVILIVEENSKEQPPEDLSQLVLYDTRKYGDTSFWFYKLSQHSANKVYSNENK